MAGDKSKMNISDTLFSNEYMYQCDYKIAEQFYEHTMRRPQNYIFQRL